MYFTSLDLAYRLLEKGINITGTMRRNRRELPNVDLIMKNEALFSSEFFTSNRGVILCAYKCKKQRNITLFTTAHEEVVIDAGVKRKPNIVTSCNVAKDS